VGGSYLWRFIIASVRLLNLLPAKLIVEIQRRSRMSDRDEPGEDGSDGAPLPAPAAKLVDQIRPAILSVLVLTLLTGCAFPLVLGLIGRALFPREADGSLLTHGGVVIGSELIGQEFSQPEYFHSRPSAAGKSYDGTSSGGTNLGPNNPKLKNGDKDLEGVAQSRRFSGEIRLRNSRYSSGSSRAIPQPTFLYGQNI